MCKQIAMFAISVAIALLIFPLSLSSQNNFSLSLDANTATGNQSVTSVNTSAGQVVAIQVFGSNLQNVIAFGLLFAYDASQVTYQGFDPGNVLPGTPQVLPEHGTSPTSVTVGIVSFSGQSPVSSGLVGTVRFRTTSGFSGTVIRLAQGQVSRGGQVEMQLLLARVELQVGSSCPADFDGNGTVGISDFLLFANRFGSSRGQANYDVRYDLDGNGSIGISDFLIFVNEFGRTCGTPTSDDHSNTRSGATVLSLGGSRSGRIETGGDVDYFRVQVSASGILTIYTTGNTDTVGRLENNSGSVLASNDDGGAFGNFRIEQAVSFDTYYIRVAGYDASIRGDYTLHAIHTTPFDLDSENGNPTGMIYANNRFYVADNLDEKAYVYSSTGQRVPSADFNLDYNPQGMTYANNRFYVADIGFSNIGDEKVFVYSSTGQRVPSADFNLDSGNGNPSGITYANNRLYVLDWEDEKVYAYSSSGQRVPSADFNLDTSNNYPEGMTYANNHFYVADYRGAKVFVYSSTGQRVPSADFNLDSGNSDPTGITYANNHFYVVDWEDEKVYVYSR